MNEKHPGGIAMTRHLLELAQLSPCRILDMGAGDGHAVKLLLKMGFDAAGIDLADPEHRSPESPSHAAPQQARDSDLNNDVYDAFKPPASAAGSESGFSCNPPILAGNFLHCPFEDGSFDAVLSECAFYVSGDPEAAIAEAARLLRKGGKLLLADVCFLNQETHRQMLEAAGFSVLHLEDITPLWKEYYIACIWNGTAYPVSSAQTGCGLSNTNKCSYYLTICERM